MRLLAVNNLLLTQVKHSLKALAFVFRNSTKASVLFLSFILLFSILLWSIPKPIILQDYSTVVQSREGHILRFFLNEKEQWHFPPPENRRISENLKNAVLLFEDEWFFVHPGINPVSLLKAFFINFKSGDIERGGSTLSMQVARLLNPKARTYKNKFIELFQALFLELRYSKKEILSLYLSFAPYGGNIVGAEAAALKYFGISIDKLTWAQAATLAVLPNAPSFIHPGKNRDKLYSKRDRLLKKLYKKKHLSKDELQLALSEKVDILSNPYNFIAPHMSRKILLSGKRGLVKTTLDLRIQRLLERMMKDVQAALDFQGVKNCSVLISDTQSGEVLGYSGSLNFFDEASEGQVDGVLAPRSTASTLKPFIYALAMDRGMALPDTWVKDVDENYNGYKPENADQHFRGLIPLSEALVYSLNAPAVAILHQLGLGTFYENLESLGFTHLFRTADEYGLPLILGGAEANLWDLNQAYRALANGGRFTPLSMILNEKNSYEADQVYSSGASYLTLEMMKELRRPGVEFYWNQFENSKPIAWKTGTSFGNRDAWAIGVNPSYTVAVWAGNFNGEVNHNLRGSQTAAPVLFDVFQWLPKMDRPDWFVKPEKALKEVQLCELSGMIASPYCPEVKVKKAPLDFSSEHFCYFHKEIFIDTKTDHRIRSDCWQGKEREKITAVFYPPDVLQTWRDENIRLPRQYAYHSDCTVDSSHEIAILYPKHNSELVIPVDFNGQREKLIMKAVHQEASAKLFWYVGNEYLGSTVNYHEMEINLLPGKHTLTVMDSFSRLKKIQFQVK